MSALRPHRIDPPSTVPLGPVASTATSATPGQVARERARVEQRDAGASGGASRQADPLQSGGPPASSSPPKPVDGIQTPVDARQTPADDGNESAAEAAGHQDWLRLHAAELLDRLQNWASDLDAREARLNARLSMQEHRERRFRLLQQDVEARLAEQQRSIERLREENLAQARRLAFHSE